MGDALILAATSTNHSLCENGKKAIKKRLRGEGYIVRFADDFVCMFEYEEEAKTVYGLVKARLAKFGLELAENKTRILPFGRNSGTTDTFDFLGFTHVNGKTRNGKYTVGHKISKKKKKLFKAKLKKWRLFRYKCGLKSA